MKANSSELTVCYCSHIGLKIIVSLINAIVMVSNRILFWKTVETHTS